MKLKDMSEDELRALERTIGHLLIDEPDIKLSELQDKILDMLGVE